MKKSIVLALMLMQILFVNAQRVTIGESFPLEQVQTASSVEAQGIGNSAVSPALSPKRILSSTEREIGRAHV